MMENELIQKLKHGSIHESENIFRSLYKDHYEMTKQLVLKNNGTLEDAKDVFQEVIIAFYHKAKQEDFELSCKVSTFLYAMSRNQWLKRLRDRKRIVNMVDTASFDIAIEDNWQDDTEYSEHQIAIAELLKNSGERCLKILKAFYFEKKSMKKIAENQGYSSEQIARNQKVRCMKKIKAAVMQNENYKNYLLEMKF